MKTSPKIILIFILAVTIFSGCQKENDLANDNKEIVENVNKENKENNENHVKDSKSQTIENKETDSKLAQKLDQVPGATIGSLSSLVEDRKLWEDFVNEEFLDSAKKYERGIHLPKILLDSDDAKAANDEIDSMAQKIKDTYEINKANMENGETGIVCNFSVYQDEKILSLMIENYDIWNGEYTDYHVYNFSLNDGKFIDDVELMENFEIDKDDILTIAENGLIKKADLVTKIYGKDITDLSYTSIPNNLIGLNLNYLWDNYELKSHQIFIDEVGRPNFVFDNYKSVDMGQGPLVFRLESDRFENNQYSDEYLRMASGLGLDPYDTKNKAFVIYLGGANDEENLQATMSKLQTWSNVFKNSEDPNLLVAIKQSDGGDMPYLIGEECYLVIPKYKNASVSLKELEITEDGKLKEVDNPYLDSNACSGTTLICQNISDIGPNGKITIRYRDEVVEFSPQLSLKDGSVILPEGILNGEDILDWDKEVQEGYYSYKIFERIKYLMGVGW